MRRTLTLGLTVALAGVTLTLAQNATGDFYGLNNRHADPNAAINASNISNLQLAWKVETNDPVSHAPLLHDGKVYFADWGGDVYAVNAQTGKVVWKKVKLENVQKDWPWHGFAGTGAIGEGKLFEASAEGTAFALDAQTGRLLWEKDFATENEYAGNVGALLYHNGKVFIGVQSVEEPLTAMRENFKPSFQGKVVALDARTGEQLWQTQLVQNPMNGVPVWTSFALDPEMNSLFFTTGNNYTGEPSQYSDAIMAVNPDNGEIKWARQVWNNDVWVAAKKVGPDYDFSGGPQLFEATINGQTRKLVGAANKGGIFFAVDRETGENVWESVISYGGIQGGMHGEASVGNGRIFAWGNNSFRAGAPIEKHPVDIKAIDSATGKYLWVQQTAHPAALSAGYLASNIYLTPSLDGRIRAWRADSGERVWTSPQHPSIGSSLNVQGNMLLFSAGLPKPFGNGSDDAAVYAYRLPGTQGQASQNQAGQGGQQGAAAAERREEAPKIEVSDQAVTNRTVNVREVVTEQPAWVVIHAANAQGNPGEVLGQTRVQSGETYGVKVNLSRAVDPNTKLFVMLHRDTGQSGTYEFGRVQGADQPITQNGQVVVKPFMVQAP